MAQLSVMRKILKDGSVWVKSEWKFDKGQNHYGNMSEVLQSMDAQVHVPDAKMVIYTYLDGSLKFLSLTSVVPRV